MKELEIYFENKLVYTLKVSENYVLASQLRTIDIYDNGVRLASVPENYLIIIK